MWRCPRCEMLNEDGQDACEVCDYKRAVNEVTVKKKWICPRCETLNLGDTNSCEVCLFERTELPAAVVEVPRLEFPEEPKDENHFSPTAFNWVGEEEKRFEENRLHAESSEKDNTNFIAVMGLVLFVLIVLWWIILNG